MADMRTYFTASILVVLGAVFVGMIWTQSLLNGGYIDTGDFPLAQQAIGYSTNIQNKTQALTNSMNATFSQNANVDIAQGIYTSVSTGGQIFSIIWSIFLIVISVLQTIFLAPLFSGVAVVQLIYGLGLAFTVGLLILIVAGVVLKWFV